LRYSVAMNRRKTVHTLVDELPDGELLAAERYLEFLRDRGEERLKILLDSAPLDDEPLTDEDLAAIREGLADEARGEVVPHEQVKKRIGRPSR